MLKKLKGKGKFIIFGVSAIATYFIFNAARTSAIAERGNANVFGGELLLLLIPIIVVVIYDNIILTAKTFGRKANKKVNKNAK